MDTLQGFLDQTKSVSYLIAVVFLVGFIGFWFYLTDRENHGEK